MCSKKDILIGNFFMVLWIFLGTLGCFFLNSIIALIYLLFAIVMVYVILRKMVCTHCYYYDKWCSMGWGKLSALFFKKEEESFDNCTGIKIAPIVYGFLTLAPIACLVVSLLSFSYERFWNITDTFINTAIYKNTCYPIQNVQNANQMNL